MSKILFNNQQTNGNSPHISAHQPSQPGHQKQPLAEKLLADPSSCLPNGKRYPIPSFFDDRAKPKEPELP